LRNAHSFLYLRNQEGGDFQDNQWKGGGCYLKKEENPFYLLSFSTTFLFQMEKQEF
jgi:hypothetical protein